MDTVTGEADAVDVLGFEAVKILTDGGGGRAKEPIQAAIGQSKSGRQGEPGGDEKEQQREGNRAHGRIQARRDDQTRAPMARAKAGRKKRLIRLMKESWESSSGSL